ncbi:MAG TPA: peptide chain release factor N(5)-glutamine methyltransferase [Micropepsaceae bacterium]|nr:peptide chain release factor N(5)-glutamine methyltransferase [Micropepsaceae bacterium]
MAATLDCDQLLDEATAELRRAGIESPRREARLLLRYAIGGPAGEIPMGRLAIPQESAELFSAALLRRCRHEPFAYITGKREFWSLPFAVSRDVLIPRPETETLIEAALHEFPSRDAPLRVLDLGTGSGCLLLALLSERPNATGIGVDVSLEALRAAARNARDLSLERRASFVRSCWTSGIVGHFDIILANPPYIRRGDLRGLGPEVAEYEPRLALDGGQDGLRAYREIAAELPRSLSGPALLFAEAGYGQAMEIRDIFAAAKFEHQKTVCDLAGIARCVVMRVNR